MPATVLGTVISAADKVKPCTHKYPSPPLPGHTTELHFLASWEVRQNHRTVLAGEMWAEVMYVISRPGS